MSEGAERVDVRRPVHDGEDGGGGADGGADRVHKRQRVAQRKGAGHHAEEHLHAPPINNN